MEREYLVEVGQVTKTASTKVKAQTPKQAKEKAMRRVGDTTRWTVIMDCRATGRGSS